VSGERQLWAVSGSLGELVGRQNIYIPNFMVVAVFRYFLGSCVVVAKIYIFRATLMVADTHYTQRGIPMSLQDQLLKAGLIDDKRANKIKKNKHKQTRQKQKNKIETTDEVKLAAQRAQAEKVERDRLLNQQRKAEAERKAITAQVRQLVEMNRQSREDGDIDYSFTDGTLVKRILITEAQLKQLTNGRLCIIKLDEQYELIPSIVAEKIQVRDTGTQILSNQSTETPDEDDPYADYQVPDDLMW
jgi:uncharacterized protein YaiL (DUF2058 family)